MSGISGALSNFATCTADAVRTTFQDKLSELLRFVLAYWVWYEDMNLEGIIGALKVGILTVFTMNWLGCISELLTGSFASLKGGVSGALGRSSSY